MKVLVLYYSYGRNTRSIAQRIQKALNCDLTEIVPVTPYIGSYDEIVRQGQREAESSFEPPVQPLAKSPNHYDAVIIGTPVWWYTPAPVVKTALSACDWNEKIVYPFATNGGWLGHTFRDMQTACEGAVVKDGLNIRFDENRQQTPMAEVEKWIANIKEETK